MACGLIIFDTEREAEVRAKKGHIDSKPAEPVPKKEADFSLTKEGFLKIETEEEGFKLMTVATSVPATIKEDLVETKRKNLLITYYIQGKLKIIESYNQDGKNEHLKTLFVSNSVVFHK